MHLNHNFLTKDFLGEMDSKHAEKLLLDHIVSPNRNPEGWLYDEVGLQDMELVAKANSK